MTDGHLELQVAWRSHVGEGPDSNDRFESVLSRYREPHRCYHDVRHLRWTVRHVGALAHPQPVADLDAIVAAAFFHDAIYDAMAVDNEAASGRLAARVLRELGWDATRIANVDAMILATAHHQLLGATVDDAILFAADLAVLAAEPAGYSDYVRNVRREYHHVGDAEWAVGRSAVLRSFLDRDAIFAPVLELGAWEQRARGNITAEIGTLAV